MVILMIQWHVHSLVMYSADGRREAAFSEEVSFRTKFRETIFLLPLFRKYYPLQIFYKCDSDQFPTGGAPAKTLW